MTHSAEQQADGLRAAGSKPDAHALPKCCIPGLEIGEFLGLILVWTDELLISQICRTAIGYEREVIFSLHDGQNLVVYVSAAAVPPSIF